MGLLYVPALLTAVFAIPSNDVTGMLARFTNSSNNWCTTCKAFSSSCAMGCAGDAGGGGPCPDNACPRVFTFTTDGASPVWNINVQVSDGIYRAFSYVPICTNNDCTAPFVFSFKFKYIGTSSFSTTNDYLKLLFWGDGNNIMGVKSGKIYGIPGDGKGDLTGSPTGSGIELANLTSGTWVSFDVKFTLTNANLNSPIAVSFSVNGVSKGAGQISAGQSSGLQFGVYTWGGEFFQVAYKEIGFYAEGQVPSPTPASAPTATRAPTSNSSGTPNSSGSVPAAWLMAACTSVIWILA